MSASQRIPTGIFIGSIIDSFLGPNKSLKYIVDDGDTILTCCPLLLLRTVSQLYPYEYLLEQVLCSHHEQYGCTNSTLLSMWYFWEQELKLLIEEGIEPCTVFSYAQSCLQEVITLLPMIEIPTEKLLHFLKKSVSPEISFCIPSSSVVLNAKPVALSSKSCKLFKDKPSTLQKFSRSRTSLMDNNQGISYGVMISSRHFSPSSKTREDETPLQHCDTYHTEVEKSVVFNEEDKAILFGLVKKICHVDFEFSDLIAKAWEHQIIYSKSVQFTLDSIAVITIVGPSSNSSVVDGLLLETNRKESFVSQHNVTCRYKALLISGDATPNYKHLGFISTSVVETCVSVEDMSIPPSKTWLNDCIDLILKLEVSMLLVRGAVDSSLIEACISKTVDIISHIPSQSFKAIAKTFSATPCSYILGCDEKNIITGITLYPWKINTQDCLLQDMEFFIINTDSKAKKYFPQTVVLYHPCKAVLNLQEHQLWHAASRLALTCQFEYVLPGGGMTEKWCCETILLLASSRQGEEAKVFQAIAAGYEKYYKAILKKFIICQNGLSDVLDEKESKVQAWHSSVSLLTTMLVDSCIINSCEKSKTEQFIQIL